MSAFSTTLLRIRLQCSISGCNLKWHQMKGHKLPSTAEFYTTGSVYDTLLCHFATPWIPQQPAQREHQQVVIADLSDFPSIRQISVWHKTVTAPFSAQEQNGMARDITNPYCFPAVLRYHMVPGLERHSKAALNYTGRQINPGLPPVLDLHLIYVQHMKEWIGPHTLTPQ